MSGHPTRPIRVLIADDSALMRQLLTLSLGSDKGIEVIGAAPNPHVARDKIASFAKRPDGHCALSLSEAVNGTRVTPGHVYIAPGNIHLELVRSGALLPSARRPARIGA